MAKASDQATGDAFSKLTETQQACLRLAATGLTSKEIAQETGLTYQTVDQYLSRAAALVGAANRREAARLFTAWEQFSRTEFKPDALAHAAPSAILQPSANPGGWPQTDSPEHVMCDSAASADGLAARLGWSVAVPPIGGEANGLTLKNRVFAILRIAAYSVIAMSVLVLILTGILNLYG